MNALSLSVTKNFLSMTSAEFIDLWIHSKGIIGVGHNDAVTLDMSRYFDCTNLIDLP